MTAPRALASPASLKGVLAARDAAAALEDGFVHVGIECDQLPLADGGEGTIDALCDEWDQYTVHDAFGRTRFARVGRRDHGVVVEAAQVIPFDPSGHDVMHASSRGLGELLGLSRGRAEDTVAPPEPILRRLSGGEVAILEVADLFNASTYRRTVGGIAKSLGQAQASIVALSGDAGEMAVTVAWDLSWYQYRVSPDSGQPVRLESRGHELDELEDTFKEWNAHVEDEGRLVPEIARL